MRNELLKSLDWDVIETPLQIAGTDTIFSGFKGLTRSDNGGQLHVVKNAYSPLKNSEFTDTLQKLSEVTGMPIEGYNDFRGGKRILGFLKNTEDFKIGGFKAENYLLLGNSHDVTSSIYFGTTDELIRCENQWGKILAAIKIRHSSNKQNKIDSVIREIETHFKEKKLYYENLERFGDIKIDQTLIAKLVNHLIFTEETNNISAVKTNQLIKLNESIRTEMAEVGDNMFGLFNGVTHYTTHKVNARGGNTMGNLFGKQGELNNKAYEFGMSLIEDRATLITV